MAAPGRGNGRPAWAARLPELVQRAGPHDNEGWVSGEAVLALIAPHHAPTSVAELLASVRRDDSRVEAHAGRLRLRPQSIGTPPDILYHAISRSALRSVIDSGRLGSRGRWVQLARSEEQAWRVAHRLWEDPMVLFIDAARARRDGFHPRPGRSGQLVLDEVGLRYLLNLRQGFAEQASAGGFLIDWSLGRPRVALIRVVRRHGSSWEIAKGKLEMGEVPAAAAVREVGEEMGISVPISVQGTLGSVRYGFSTPDGSPRLKTVYLFLLETEHLVGNFTPANNEGIDAVRWFELREGMAALSHPSLRGARGRLLSALRRRAGELGIRSRF